MIPASARWVVQASAQEPVRSLAALQAVGEAR
jgi:hypothetical protein